jgi:hypothetical protein
MAKKIINDVNITKTLHADSIFISNEDNGYTHINSSGFYTYVDSGEDEGVNYNNSGITVFSGGGVKTHFKFPYIDDSKTLFTFATESFVNTSYRYRQSSATITNADISTLSTLFTTVVDVNDSSVYSTTTNNL